ncbi:MAG: isoprenylcysteine carboxylmethyltransferase family protein [Cyanobacteria bacterium P01_F01_bin.143]
MLLIFHNIKKFLLENANKILGVVLSIFCLLKIYVLWQYWLTVQDEVSRDIFGTPSQLILNNLVQLSYLAIAAFILLMAKKPKRKYAKSTPTIISLLGSFLPYLLLLSPVSESFRLTSALLVFLGGTISLMGILSLRKSFSITPEVRGLVVSGLYLFIRHPMYLGGFVAAAGIVLSSPSFFSLVIYLLWLIVQVWRSRLEEKLLIKEYPEYEKYRKKTSAFLPIPGF